MSITRDRVVAYQVWAKDGTLLRQSSLALLSGAESNLDLPARLKEHAQSEGELNWDRVACLSYVVLESIGVGKDYRRYNGWLDQAELEENDEVLTTVATITAPIEAENELANTNPQELIETVEEILREDRQGGE